MSQDVLLVLTAIGLFSLVSQWLAWRLKVPAILFLLASGLLMGPVSGVLDPDALFGDLLFPFISLAVAVIIFEGSLTLNFDEIRGHGVVVRNLISLGLLIIWLLIALLAHFLVGLHWELAVLFGAIMTVTGPTVVMPMLQAVRPTRAVANILRWEGILVDPLGAIFAVITFSVVVATQTSTHWIELLAHLLRLLGTGLAVGLLGGWAWGWALRRYWVPQFLHNVATLLVVFAVFAISNVIAHESGLLAVTAMGVWLANARGIHIRSLLDFKESLSILLISALFILLAARLQFDQLSALGWPALLLILGIQCVARPLKVAACTVGSSLGWRERAMIGWIGPRGIVAAAISAVFAERLLAQDVADAQLLVPLAFTVIAGTVVIQSLTARPLAKALGVAAPAPEGVLILGVNSFAIALGKVLKEAGFTVVVADNDWDSLRDARMAGLRTYYGNPMSNHAERTLDLSGIGRLFAMSRNTEFNRLACTYFAHQFGRREVFMLPVSMVSEDGRSNSKTKPSMELPGRRLFAEDVSLAKLLSYISRGAEIKATRLSETYDFEQFLADGDQQRILLAAWNDKGRLAPYSKRWESFLEPGWTIASLSLKEPAARETLNR
ncbi:sodium:proton antiporter [Mangrovimicrobium sediminis]|uniref:Sodium:proton antiporter n=1 Tax=Mangrovimicrobium sediminis TaxID=2562682 RepID=A0A4Z0M1K8_9GAMM|nr:sodium:proton antiporter [Haliea sp. SAOS-164]TGD73421.1 sodium:proton antiporter [Haliea sp. SAOS-164]